MNTEEKILLDYLKKDLIKAFNNIEFIENNHTYLYKPEKIFLPSVSSKYKKFEIPFDSSIAKFVAKSKKITEQEVLKEWKEKANNSAKFGTETHKFAEYYGNGKKIEPINDSELGVVEFFNDHPNYIVVAQELVVYHKYYRYAGTMDLILYDKEKKIFILADWKGLPLDTPILTNNGWKIMNTLNLKDKVFDKDGNLCNIKNISSIHNKKCLKIIFDNNEEITSDFEHKWLVDIYKKEKVLTTQQLKDYWDNKKEKYKNKIIPSCYHIKIPNTKPLNCKEKELPIDPYILGLWLGDGHKVDGKITQMNLLVWKEIEKRGYIIGNDVSQGGSGKAQTRTIFNLSSKLKELNLLNNKHIPYIYLLSSYNQRLDLLRGLMDADGYYNPIRKRFELSTTRNYQVEFTIKILSSLGIKPTVIKSKKYLNNKKFDILTINFTTLINPFLCRNQNIKILTNNQHKYRRIKDIIEVEKVQTKCIEVDSPSNTYLFGHTLIPTHNTNEDLHKNYKNKLLLSPFENILDTPLNKYKIQLNLYDMCLEEKGFPISERLIIWLNKDEKNNKKYKLYNIEDLKPILKQYYDNNS